MVSDEAACTQLYLHRLTMRDSQLEPESSPNTSSRDVVDPELARAKRKAKLRPKPSWVPTNCESQSRVSISSDSHSKKSMGFSIETTRSQSGLRRTSLGILAAGRRGGPMLTECRGLDRPCQPNEKRDRPGLRLVGRGGE